MCGAILYWSKDWILFPLKDTHPPLTCSLDASVHQWLHWVQFTSKNQVNKTAEMLLIYFLGKPTHQTNRNQKDLLHGPQLPGQITTLRAKKHLTILCENYTSLLPENCCPVGNQSSGESNKESREKAFQKRKVLGTSLNGELHKKDFCDLLKHLMKRKWRKKHRWYGTMSQFYNLNYSNELFSSVQYHCGH